MGQRHNRRRTRPRSHHRNNLRQDTPVSTVLSSSSLATPWSPNTLPESLSVNQSTAACISPGYPVSLPAPTWHYGYTEWPVREASPQLESGRLEAEQCRLFGGKPGDDVSLCYRMLEYFGGLDYIDS